MGSIITGLVVFISAIVGIIPNLNRESCNVVQHYQHHALNSTHLFQIEDALHGQLFGQNASVDLIASAFRTREKGKPLSFHFVGENGVGKTLASQLIGKTIFHNPNKDILYIRGNSYQTLLQENIELYRETIRKKVADYISRCPYGLVIVDEVETVHPKIITLFQEFLDYTFSADVQVGNLKVPVDKAIFIFISDFGTEGYTHGMTIEQIMTEVRVESEKQWSNYKQISLIQHIVPFLPMTREGVHDHVMYLLQSLKKHDRFSDWKVEIKSLSFCSQQTIEQLADNIYEKTVETLSPENYRGVGKVFSHEVSNPMLKKIQKFVVEQRAETDGRGGLLKLKVLGCYEGDKLGFEIFKE